MNNKEFIATLAQKTGYKMADVQSMVQTAIHTMIDQLCEDEMINITNLGCFDVKKRAERIIQNPSTGQKMLVPPKLVVNFKAYETLKEKIKG